MSVADLTTLGEKPAEVTGLAGAAQETTKKVESMLDDDSLAETMRQMLSEADETESRCIAVSPRDIFLADLSDDMLAEMRREHETRFVESKASLGKGDGAFNFAKAVASFANTLGGWVLVGLDDSGEFVVWEAPEAHSMTDRVRQALERQIDPMPPFAATVAS